MVVRQRYRLPAIAEFRRQLRFTRGDALRKQVIAAESLLFEVAMDRVYPGSWVVWRITGFRPEEATLAEALLEGCDLRHDLALFMQELAMEVDFKSDDRPLGAVTTEEAAARLGVSVRTVQRWRERGLPLIPIRFADGRRRRGCYLETLERFAAVEAAFVERGRRFARVRKGERKALQKAVTRKISTGLAPSVAADDVARETGRSSGAVRRAAEFEVGRVRLPQNIGRILLRAHDRRIPESELIDRLGRSAATLRRLQLKARVDRVRSLQLDAVSVPTASMPDAAEVFAAAGGLDDQAARLHEMEVHPWLEFIREGGTRDSVERMNSRIATMHFVHARASQGIDAFGENSGSRLVDPVEQDLAWGGQLLERTVLGLMHVAVRRFEQSVDFRLDTMSHVDAVNIIHALFDRTAAVVLPFDPGRKGAEAALERAVGLGVAKSVASDPRLGVGASNSNRATVDSLGMLPARLREILGPVRWWRNGGAGRLEPRHRRLVVLRHGLEEGGHPRGMRELGKAMSIPPTRLVRDLADAERALRAGSLPD